MSDTFPITAEDLSRIPRARATRLSYNWSRFGRYSVWIAEASYFGWSVMADYGKPGQENVVTSPRNREDCISALADYVHNYGEPGFGYDLLVESWETVSATHDAWITQTQAMGLRWSPLPR